MLTVNVTERNSETHSKQTQHKKYNFINTFS